MIYTVKQGEHRARPNMFGIGYNRKRMKMMVRFGEFWRNHNPSGVDRYDINKVFGLGFASFGQILSALLGFFSQKYVPDAIHHTDSARFGARYNSITDEVDIFDYCYVDGDKPRIDPEAIARFKINTFYLMEIVITRDHYIFYVNDDPVISVEKNHNKKWSYVLGMYIGGDTPAQVDVKTEMKKL